MFAASARSVNANPVTINAAREVARRAEGALVSPAPVISVRADPVERWRATQAQIKARAKRMRASRARRKIRRARRWTVVKRGLTERQRLILQMDRTPYKLIDVAWRICWFHGITLAELKDPSRKRHLTYARQQFCFWAHSLGLGSLPEIGRFLGGQHHTTVLRARRSYKGSLQKKRAKRAGQ